MKTLRTATMFGLIVLSAKGLFFVGKHSYKQGVKPTAKVVKLVLI